MISPKEHAELVVAVRQAGHLLLSLWPGGRGERDNLSLQSKADGSYVTQADLLSNEMLIDTIVRLFPKDAILSEESPVCARDLTQSRRTWVIDPLDGTRSFVEGCDDFSVLVSLCEALSPVYGIMFFPARDLMVEAMLGSSATCNGNKIGVSLTSVLEPGRVYIRNFDCRRPELAAPMRDSGAALLDVARGELDGAIIRMTTHQEWDIAAPMAVIEAAGGKVTDQTGARVQLGRGSVHFKYLIASNSLIHEQLQALT